MPTSTMKPSRALISRMISFAIRAFSRPSSMLLIQRLASRTFITLISWMRLPPTVTALAKGLSREPPQAGHSFSCMNFITHCFTLSESLLSKRFSMSGITPGKPPRPRQPQRPLVPGSPRSTSCWAEALSLRQGVLTLTPRRLQCLRKARLYQPASPGLFQPAMAPSSMDLSGSGTRACSLSSVWMPRPWQTLQAPWGALKLNNRGSSSPISASGCSGQNILALKVWSCQASGVRREAAAGDSAFSAACCLPPAASLPRACACGSCFVITHNPSARCRATSTASLSLERDSLSITMRSITTSMSCFLCLSSAWVLGPTSITCPFRRARTKPSRITLANTSRCSPLRPRTTGASTISFVPWGHSITVSTICSALWLLTSRLQTGQRGVPARAYNRRR
ncbi:MAG: hypothetical protein ICCCNLDF_03533 [Planctomycetes bacterium]|nr:hypothetical protein [Planctomycetota bacterium]